MLALLATGCAEVELRQLKPEERSPLRQALDPLLRAAYGDDVGNCTFAVGVEDATRYDARITRAGDGPCDMAVVVTTATLTELTPRALQTASHVERAVHAG